MHALEGVRVIDFGQYLAGPFGPMIIGDLGADVIKVEPPAGDYVRRMTWPIVEGTSLMHLHVNRGKRSVVADFRDPADLAFVRALIADADVVIENMRPGVCDRLGIGYEAVRAVNPRIVYCSIEPSPVCR